MLLYVNPNTVVLSVLIGVGGRGWWRAMSIWRMSTAVCALCKMPHASTSAADATTFLSILHSMSTVSLVYYCRLFVNLLFSLK